MMDGPAPQQEIEALRQLINRIDQQIVKLLDERMQIAFQIGQLKSLLGKDVLDEQREAAVFENIRSTTTRMLNQTQVEQLFIKIIKLGREFGEKGIAKKNIRKES
ncbi:MAG TPA: hypothetical protein ENN84_10880 [Candidatus Marinimicrobia bacterium]|mgnify:CR=1 FL=1|nr:hypothetical protein [Candidatus Neomarinimicrobiota bacterium]